MRAARRKPSFGSAQLLLLLAAGCSLQDFDYLQKGTGGSNAGGTSSTAGTSAAGTDDGEGGEAAGPSAGGTGEAGGTGGTKPMAGTSSGGTSSGGSNAGGSSSGNGGKGGTGGMEPTGELANGSFESGTISGWTVTPASALMNPPRYAFVQPPTSGATVPDGGYEFSTWHMVDAFSVDLHQTVKGLEDGTYVFKGYFNLGAGHNLVEVYASDCGADDPEPVAVLPSGDAVWSPVVLEGIVVEGGSCTVGVRIDSNPLNWLNADLFTFELDPNANPGGAGGAGGVSSQ